MVDIVSADYFETLGVAPVYGRDFTLEEERPGTAARPVIISYTLWERAGFDRDILKQTVRINGQDYRRSSASRRSGFSGTTVDHRHGVSSCRSACTTRSKATSIRDDALPDSPIAATAR